jgi:hypothetical protein
MARPLPRCRWCKHPLTDPGTATASSRLRNRHCTNAQCTWCQACVSKRYAAAQAGYRIDDTQELPAVADDGPPTEGEEGRE